MQTHGTKEIKSKKCHIPIYHFLLQGIQIEWNTFSNLIYHQSIYRSSEPAVAFAHNLMSSVWYSIHRCSKNHGLPFDTVSLRLRATKDRSLTGAELISDSANMSHVCGNGAFARHAFCWYVFTLQIPVKSCSSKNKKWNIPFTNNKHDHAISMKKTICMEYFKMN